MGLGQAAAGAFDSLDQRAADNHGIGEFNDPCGLLRSGDAEPNPDWNRRHPSHLRNLRTQLFVQGLPRPGDSGYGYIVNKAATLPSDKFYSILSAGRRQEKNQIHSFGVSPAL